MTISSRNATKLALIAALLICARTVVAKEACSLVSNDEMSGLVGTKFVQAMASGVNEQAGVTSCAYVTGTAPEVPSALVILSESERMYAAMTRGCRGLEQLEGLGDQACIESDEHMTTIAATKGGKVLMVVLISRSDGPDQAGMKSAARKIVQTALSRLL